MGWDSDHNVSFVNTEENRNGMNSERELKEEEEEEGRRGLKGQLLPRLVLVKDD